MEKWMKKLGIPIALLVFGLLMTMSTPVGMTFQAKAAVAVFAMALILWVTQAIPTYASALLVIVMLTLTGGWDQKSVLGVFGYDVIWLMISAFIITSGMEKSGVAKRLALFIVSKFGSTAKKALLSLAVVNFLLAFVVPSTTARAALLLPITLMICKVYQAVPGESNFGRQLMLQEVHFNNISTSAILTATAPQIMAVGYIKDMAKTDVSWMQWFAAGMPIAVLTMAASYFLGNLLFKSEVEVPPVSQDDSSRSLKEEYKNLGPMKAIEKKALFIFLLTVFLWSTDGYHLQMFGFKISLVMVAVLSALLFFLPYIGILTWDETKVPWNLMIFSAGAYAGGLALDKSGAASFMLTKIFGSFDLVALSPFLVYMLVMFIASFSHFVFTSKVVRTVILMPAIIGIANQTGVNPISLALPAALTICDSITLPPHCKPNLIFYSTGYFTVTDQLVYGVLVLLAKWVILGAAYFTWFRVIGLV
jgi:anion transporter